MKIKEGFVLKELAGMQLIIPLGEHIETHKSLMILNDTGAFLWNQLKDGCSEKLLAQKMAAYYEIPEDMAVEDLNVYLEHLRSMDVVEEE